MCIKFVPIIAALCGLSSAALITAPQEVSDNYVAVNTTSTIAAFEFAGLERDDIQFMAFCSNVRGVIVYTLGNRAANDQLVAHGAKNQKWNQPQNVVVTLTYPASGVGAQVTFVQISVNQATNLGQAYVVRGGLHQRFITINVEGYNTDYLNYEAFFYGV